ncbi:MAG TPA: hypothetical protein VFP22_00530 [Candidatus Limnocylindrales bacterium]|nr:hypothetical protein [Candidatus Limnocylindrales bacterium]
MTTRYDYDALELEFVQGPDELSVRELAKRHGISAWSTVNAQAQKRNWKQKREDYRAKLSSKTLELLADKTAEEVLHIRSDFLKVLRAAILKMGSDMRDRTVTDYDFKLGKQVERVVPGIQVTPSDIVKMITAMQTLTGQPSSITEERHLGIDLSGLDPELLREVANLTYEPDAGPARRAALPSPRSAGQN